MNTSTQFGIGSFLAGFTQGFEKTQELKMKQKEMELKQATLESEQAKLDLSLQKEANDKQIKTQQEIRKAQEDANKSFEENAGKYGAKVAVDRFNSTISTSDNPVRKFIWTDLNGGEHIIDTTVDRIGDMKFINAEYLTKKGEGKYNFDPKTSTVYGKNENGQFVPTSYTGTDVNVFKTAYEKGQAGTGVTTLEDGTVVTNIEALGKKAQDKRPVTKVDISMDSGEKIGDVIRAGQSSLKDANWNNTNPEIANKYRETAQNVQAILSTKWNSNQAKKVDEFDTSVNMENTFVGLRDKFDTINKGNAIGGIPQEIKKTVIDYLGAGKDVSELVGMNSDFYKSLTSYDSETRAAIVDYVKLISGASVTNTERQDLFDIAFGSGYKSNDARRARIDGFITSLKTKNTNTANSIKSYAPDSAGNYLYGTGGRIEKAEKKVTNVNAEENSMSELTKKTTNDYWNKILEKRKLQGK